MKDKGRIGILIILTRYNPPVSTFLQYTDSLQFTPEVRSEDEMIQGVRNRLLEAVRVRLRADVPVAIYLSGGLDSSSVAGMVSYLMKEGAKLGSESNSTPSSMKCFTVQFEESSGADESSRLFSRKPRAGIQIKCLLL
jgi:asparagine synthase (glutamine-hydrolysing)